jgi:hypothetical protein
LTKEEARDKENNWGGVAQSVEQRTENPRVPSSILGPATTDFKGLAIELTFFIPSYRKFTT